MSLLAPYCEREQELGEKAKRFTNVFIKNFGEELSEDELTSMFSKYGQITSVKVRTVSNTPVCFLTLIDLFTSASAYPVRHNSATKRKVELLKPR